eukprot:scaffold259_cov252-Pinguiococcus_pyrenoidosus.AAC.30
MASCFASRRSSSIRSSVSVVSTSNPDSSSLFLSSSRTASTSCCDTPLAAASALVAWRLLRAFFFPFDAWPSPPVAARIIFRTVL